MDAYSTIHVVRNGSVDWLTLNRPDRLNAINGTMVRELWHYFGGLHSDYECRVVVMRGAGKAFCSGLDLHWFSDSGESMPTGPTDSGPEASLRDIILRMRSCPQPIVSLVHGAACGGGFSFFLAADIRIAGRSAKMNVAYVKLGLSGCELGTSYYLPKYVGSSVASELMMTGRFLSAERALGVGLVSEVVDDECLEDVARTLSDEMLTVSPMGLRKTKEIMGCAAGMDDLSAVMALEEATQLACMQSGVFKIDSKIQAASPKDRQTVN